MIGMRLKIAAVYTLTLHLFAIVVASATSPIKPCELPPDLGDEVSKRYPGTHIVTQSDLDKYDRKLFQKDHGNRCPGLVRVNFFGDGKPTWALVLIAGENPKRKAELIVAHKVGEEWEIRSLEKTDGTPVVWREGPGKYEGMYKETPTIHAVHPVIVFCGYESWSIVYSWTGKEVVKVWTSD